MQLGQSHYLEMQLILDATQSEVSHTWTLGLRSLMSVEIDISSLYVNLVDALNFCCCWHFASCTWPVIPENFAWTLQRNDCLSEHDESLFIITQRTSQCFLLELTTESYNPCKINSGLMICSHVPSGQCSKVWVESLVFWRGSWEIFFDAAGPFTRILL